MKYSRINVIGSSGSGKSTLAKSIATKLSAPYIEMDSLFWLPDWKHHTDEKFRSIIEKECSASKWILDGNYTHTQDIKWKNVEAIVWIDLPFYRNFYQSLKRTIKRCSTREELWKGTGNHETFKMSFLSKDSVLLWLIQVYSKNKKKFEEVMSREEYSHIDFYRLTSKREIDEFLSSFENKDKD